MDPEQYGLYRALTDLREPYRCSSFTCISAAAAACLPGVKCNSVGCALCIMHPPMMAVACKHLSSSGGHRLRLALRLLHNWGKGSEPQVTEKMHVAFVVVTLCDMQDTCTLSGQHQEISGAGAAGGSLDCLHQLQVWGPRRTQADRGPLPHTRPCTGTLNSARHEDLCW